MFFDISQSVGIDTPCTFFFFDFLYHCYGAVSRRGRILEAYAIPPTPFLFIHVFAITSVQASKLCVPCILEAFAHSNLQFRGLQKPIPRLNAQKLRGLKKSNPRLSDHSPLGPRARNTSHTFHRGVHGNDVVIRKRCLQAACNH